MHFSQQSESRDLQHPPANRLLQIIGHQTIQALLVLLLLLVIFFWPAIIGGQILLPTDLIFDVDPLWQPLAPKGYSEPGNALLADQVNQFLPWQIFIRYSLNQGELPLWNPYTSGGQPFIGNAQSRVFDPFNWIGYLVPLYASFALVAILRLLISGLFTFLLAREIGLSKPGALLAMIVFTFSGPMIVWVGYPLASVIAWLPAMLFTTEKLLTSKNNLYLVAGGLVIGAQFLGGHPETSFPVMLAWGVYALYRTISLKGWRLIKILPPLQKLAVMAAIGLLLGAAQLLPSGEALLQSAALAARQNEVTANSFTLARLFLDWQEWPSLITAVLPQYFGTPLNNSFWYPYDNYVELNTYAGIIPLALAASIIFYHLKNRATPRRKMVLFLGGAAMLCLGIALHLPLINALNALPPFNISGVGRLRLIYVLIVAILAGIGFDEIGRGNQLQRRNTLRLLIVFALGSLVLITVTYAGFTFFKDTFIENGRAFVEARQGTPYLSHPLVHYYRLVEERQERKLALFNPGNIVMYLPILSALIYLTLHHWGNKRKAGRTIGLYAISALTVLDLFLVGMPFNPTTPPEQVYPTPAAVEFLKQDPEIYRISGSGPLLNPNSSLSFGLADIRGYDPMTPRRYANLISQLRGYFPIHHHAYFTAAGDPLFDLLNVKYVLTDQDLKGKWNLVYDDAGGIKIFQNREVLPRAFVVYQAEITNSESQSLARLTDDSFDFREAVVLEEMPADLLQQQEIPGSPAQVNITNYEPNRVRLTVDTPAPGLLTLTDTYTPGWEALLNGQKTQVYVANHAFRAIVIPAGRHEVEFVYNPPLFWIGAGVSILTVAALILICLFFQVKHLGKLSGGKP